ncbi:MAG: DUF4149 domain-containing protein [Hyphomicrobiales bacterium]|nr:MAG: DUF4149 domain-containing protein [Hyphomicrobiales bacterium]
MFADTALLTIVSADIALVLAAFTLGIMLFFGAVVAPTAFRVFERTEAGRMMRALFPQYYLTAGASAVLGALAAVPASRFATVLLFLSAVGFLWLRQGLLPRIDRLRQKADAGDEEAQAGFTRLHKLSVRANLLQLVMIIGAVVVLIG